MMRSFFGYLPHHKYAKKMTNTEDENRMYGIPVLTDVMSHQCEQLLESLSEINEEHQDENITINPPNGVTVNILRQNSDQYNLMNDKQKCFADAAIDKIINQNVGKCIGCLDAAAGT